MGTGGPHLARTLQEWLLLLGTAGAARNMGLAGSSVSEPRDRRSLRRPGSHSVLAPRPCLAGRVFARASCSCTKRGSARLLHHPSPPPPHSTQQPRHAPRLGVHCSAHTPDATHAVRCQKRVRALHLAPFLLAPAKHPLAHSPRRTLGRARPVFRICDYILFIFNPWTPCKTHLGQAQAVSAHHGR